ncbi:hypothetical protein AAC387_Pa04g1060 [Persea americana]
MNTNGGRLGRLLSQYSSTNPLLLSQLHVEVNHGNEEKKSPHPEAKQIPEIFENPSVAQAAEKPPPITFPTEWIPHENIPDQIPKIFDPSHPNPIPTSNPKSIVVPAPKFPTEIATLSSSPNL